MALQWITLPLFPAAGGTEGKIVNAGVGSTVSASDPWITVSTRFIQAGTYQPNMTVDVTVAANAGAQRSGSVTLSWHGHTATAAVVQEASEAYLEALPKSPKELIDESLVNHVLPWVSGGRLMANAPFAALYPDSLRTSVASAVPASPVLASDRTVLFQALEQTSTELVADPATGMLLPRPFKAVLFSMGRFGHGLCPAPASFCIPAAGTAFGMTRIKLVSSIAGSATGYGGDGYLKYALADCVLLATDYDYLRTWGGAMPTALAAPTTLSEPGEAVRSRVINILRSLAVPAGPGQRVIVMDMARPGAAAQCGALTIGVRPAAVKMQSPASFPVSATVEAPDSFPWQLPAARQSQATTATVVVPVSFLCGVCEPNEPGSPVRALSAVSDLVAAAAAAVSSAGRRELMSSTSSASYAGWLSVSVEAESLPRQVQGRPDLFYATMNVTAVVPVLVGEGL